MLTNVELIPISDDRLDDLANLYKAVFSGHPWHEDLICESKGCERFGSQYTYVECDREDTGQQAVNCREQYRFRSNPRIFLLAKEADPVCMSCGSELISYYPGHTSHHRLLGNALQQRTFVGYLALLNGQPAGFSFGYAVPTIDTPSVAFSQVTELLIGKGLNLKHTFYAAETGVADYAQGERIGGAVHAKRILDARQQGMTDVVFRTLNPFVHRYFSTSFGGKRVEELFTDPVRQGSKWFRWKMTDLDESAVNDQVRCGRRSSQ